jgi:predicted O-linked N-acetylglucosamine transferase (SPINDLY family)
LKPVLANHNPSSFELHCFSNSNEIDPITQILRELCPKWHSVADLSDDDFTELIRDERIDILVDLSGHTNRNRLRALARHPAPVQVTWLGYLNTTGLAAMDYRICDGLTDPPGSTEALHTEKLFRTTRSQWCYEPWAAPPMARHDATLSDTVAFGSVNRSRKITEPCLDLWCRILTSVPAAKLLILDVAEGEIQPLLSSFEKRSINSSRLTLLGRQPLETYYKTIARLDVALDTFPYNGATTTLDTLWMGTPIVALLGQRGLSRGSYSILSCAGLQELIAETPDEYVELNIRLAQDEAWRRELRRSLPSRLAASPLMNTGGFVADLENGYRQMWQAWCEARITKINDN